jgi:hypothetical protein
VDKNSTNGCCRLHCYSCKIKTVIQNSLYVFDNWLKNLNHIPMQYSYSKEMFTGRAKPFRIIGFPDNQQPDKWNSTVLLNPS